MPKKISPLLITWMISVPTMAPITVPEPPDSGVPPMMTAATTTSTKSDPSFGSMAPRNPTYIAPDRPQIAPIKTVRRAAGAGGEEAAVLVRRHHRAPVVDHQRQALEHRERAERDNDRRQSQHHREQPVHQPERG